MSGKNNKLTDRVQKICILTSMYLCRSDMLEGCLNLVLKLIKLLRVKWTQVLTKKISAYQDKKTAVVTAYVQILINVTIYLNIALGMD